MKTIARWQDQRRPTFNAERAEDAKTGMIPRRICGLDRVCEIVRGVAAGLHAGSEGRTSDRCRFYLVSLAYLLADASPRSRPGGLWLLDLRIIS